MVDVNRIARLRGEALAIYRALGIEPSSRDLEQVIEEDVMEVFRLHVKRETAEALGVPVIAEAEDAEDELEG